MNLGVPLALSNRTKDHDRSSPMMVSPLWLQESIMTFVIGFSLLTFSAIRIYQDAAPIPERIEDESGNLLFTSSKSWTGKSSFSPTV